MNLCIEGMFTLVFKRLR